MKNASRPKTGPSLAGLKLSKPASTIPGRSTEETAALFQSLRKLKNESGPNRNTSADTLIKACLIAGINTRAQIIGVLRHFEYQIAHIVNRLNYGLGGATVLADWRLNPDGTYELLS